jgi:hypothetical protein
VMSFTGWLGVAGRKGTRCMGVDDQSSTQRLRLRRHVVEA